MKLHHLSSLAWVITTVLASTSSVTSTYKQCLTSQGTKRVSHVPTTTKTVSSTHRPVITVTTTVTPYVTSTPTVSTPTTTTTVTFTSTITLAQLTDTDTVTATSTVTSISVDTSTVPLTVDGGTTVITSMATGATVSTVAGFTPVMSVPSVVQNGGGTESRRRRSIQQPRIEKRSVSAKNLLSSTPDQKCPARYPKSVTCTKKIVVYPVSTRTVTAKPRTVIVPIPSPTASTETTTVTTLSTAPNPDATTTVTITTISTTVSTSTTLTTSATTSVSTTTTIALASPVYAACASDNIINTVGRTALDNANSPDFFSNVPAPNDPVACCNTCQATSKCAGWILNNFSGYTCVLVGTDGGTCDPSVTYWDFYGNTGNNQVSLGNGPCGQGDFL